jgi:ribonuclease HI
MFILEFDGMVRGLDEQVSSFGLLGFGWLLSKQGGVVAHGFGLVARKAQVTSNIAEYLALTEGLDALADMRLWNAPIEIRGDAKGVIDQMIGRASVNSSAAQESHHKAHRIAARFNHLKWVWVPRCKNKYADRLSRRGLRQLFNTPGAYEKAVQRLTTRGGAGRELFPLIDLRVYSTANAMPVASVLGWE